MLSSYKTLKIAGTKHSNNVWLIKLWWRNQLQQTSTNVWTPLITEAPFFLFQCFISSHLFLITDSVLLTLFSVKHWYQCQTTFHCHMHEVSARWIPSCLNFVEFSIIKFGSFYISVHLVMLKMTAAVTFVALIISKDFCNVANGCTTFNNHVRL